jgi:hypothetical protein
MPPYQCWWEKRVFVWFFVYVQEGEGREISVAFLNDRYLCSDRIYVLLRKTVMLVDYMCMRGWVFVCEMDQKEQKMECRKKI